MSAELVLDALERLGLRDCPVCVKGALLVQFDPPTVACARSCSATDVRAAVHQCARRLTGDALGPARDALMELISRAGEGAPEPVAAVSDVPRGKVLSETKLPWMTADELLASTPADTVWVAWPLAAEGMLTEVTGRAKAAGKTTLLTHMIRSVVSGAVFLGRPTKRGAVVLLTEERPATLRLALSRAGVSGPDLHVLSRDACGALAWPDVVSAALARCREVRAVLLIVDTISPFAGLTGDQENNAGDALAAVAPLQAALAAYPTLAVLCVRHERKGGGEVGEAGRGSTAFTGAVDITASLQRLPGANDKRRLLKLVGRAETPESLTVELTDEGYVVRCEGAFSAVDEAREVVLGAVRARPGIREDDLASLGVPRATLRLALKGLQEDGVMVREGGGKRGDPFRFRLVSDQTLSPMLSETNSAGHGAPA